MSKALDHERAQFTLVGLFSRFGITANFSGGDPGAKKERKAFYKNTLLFLYLFPHLPGEGC